MDENKEDEGTFSEDWFTVCKQKFKNLPSSEKSALILTLIDMCDTTARFNLLKSCNKALHCDILALVPQIALEKILGMLSVPDALNACKVSSQWNRCISQCKYVWKKKWLEMGIGSVEDQKEFYKRDWKEDCIVAQGLYSEIKRHKALDYDLDQFNDNFGHISAIDYSNGKLVLCHSSETGGDVFGQQGPDWNYLCSFPVNEHGYPSTVRFLPSNLLVVGCYNGKVTIWRFVDLRPTLHHEVRLLHSCQRHTSIVLSVDGCEELGVVISGSRDARVKVWSLNTGTCLKTYDYSSPVLQVSFFCGENSLMKDYNFMLIHSSEKIILRFWLREVNWLTDDLHEQCIVNGANTLPGIHIKNGRLYYCSVSMIDGLQHTDFNCKHLNLPAIVGNHSENFIINDHVVTFQGNPRKLMQVGSVFSLLVIDDNIMAIDISTGSILFKEYAPYSAATSPSLPQITIGAEKWLNGLLHVKQCGMLLALAIYGRIILVSWAPSIPEFTFKND